MAVVFDPFTGQIIDTGSSDLAIGGPVIGADPNAILITDEATALSNVQLTEGQVLVGTETSPGVVGPPTQKTISGTQNQVNVSYDPSEIVFSTPQDIDTTSSPTFAGMTITPLSGPVKATAGVLSASSVDLESEVTGVLPVQNGGTNTDVVPTNGQILIGNGTDYTVSNITSSETSSNEKRIIITNGAGTIDLDLPQDISQVDSPEFAGMTLTGFSGPVKATAGVLSSSAIDLESEVSGVLPIENGGTNTSSVPTNGQILIGNGADYTVANITSSTLPSNPDRIIITNDSGSIDLDLPQDINTTSSPTFANLNLGQNIGGSLESIIDISNNVGPSDTLNIGITNADIINIGNSGAQVNIYGDTVYQNVTNLNVTDKNITVNVGGSTGSSFNSGIHVEEDVSGTPTVVGYAEVNPSRDGWNFKAPIGDGVANFVPGDDGFTIENNTGSSYTIDQGSHNPVTIATPENGLSIDDPYNQVLSIAVADSTTTGALSSTDWNTFNNKQNALTFGDVSTTTDGVTITNGADSTVGPDVEINIATASSVETGLLTSTDWNTFNDKQDALTFGNISTVTTGVTITNGDSSTVGPNVEIEIATASASENGLLTSTDWSTFNNKQDTVIYVVKAYDLATDQLPNSTPYTIDAYSLQDGDSILFGNIDSILSPSTPNNRIYTAAIDNNTITWTLNATTFEVGNQVVVQNGNSFARQIGVFNGQSFDFNKTVRYFNGKDYWEQSALYSVLLDNNSQNPVFSGGLNVSNSENMIIDYSIARGSLKTTGTLHITCTNSSVQISDTGVGAVGAQFSGSISMGVLYLNCDTDDSGSAGELKYCVRRWSDLQGGPGGLPSYSGGGIVSTINIEEVSTTNPTVPFNNISTIQFDNDTGFNVEQVSPGTVKVSLGSTFKTWNIDNGAGVEPGLEAVGEDTMTFVAGTNVQFVADNTAGSKTLTINATGGGSGEVNTASNVGAGEGVFKQKVAEDLEFKSLVAGTNVSLISDANTITISSTDTGEVNTASNVGSGDGIFKQKTGVDLEFKSLIAGENISITSDTDAVTITALPTTETIQLQNNATNQNVSGFIVDPNSHDAFTADVSVKRYVATGVNYVNNISDQEFLNSTQLADGSTILYNYITGQQQLKLHRVAADGSDVTAFNNYVNDNGGFNNSNSSAQITSVIDVREQTTGAKIYAVFGNFTTYRGVTRNGVCFIDDSGQDIPSLYDTFGAGSAGGATGFTTNPPGSIPANITAVTKTTHPDLGQCYLISGDFQMFNGQTADSASNSIYGMIFVSADHNTGGFRVMPVINGQLYNSKNLIPFDKQTSTTTIGSYGTCKWSSPSYNSFYRVVSENSPQGIQDKVYNLFFYYDFNTYMPTWTENLVGGALYNGMTTQAYIRSIETNNNGSNLFVGGLFTQLNQFQPTQTVSVAKFYTSITQDFFMGNMTYFYSTLDTTFTPLSGSYLTINKVSVLQNSSTQFLRICGSTGNTTYASYMAINFDGTINTENSYQFSEQILTFNDNIFASSLTSVGPMIQGQKIYAINYATATKLFKLIGTKLNTSFVLYNGDSFGTDVGVVFSIASSGQLKYTSSNIQGGTPFTMKYKLTTL